MTTVRPRATRLLDTGDPAEIARFERGFYEGFSHATHNRLVRWLWDWDHDARRLRTRISYAEQRIWALSGTDGALNAAIAVNVALRTLQGAAYGFAVPAELATGRVCEFLTFFSVADFSLSGKHALWTELFDDLRAEGFTHALATTSPKILPMYRRMGVQVIGEATLEGEVRYFLQFDLGQTAGTRRRGSPKEKAAGTPDGDRGASFRLPVTRAGVGMRGVNQPQPIHIRSLEVTALDIPLFEPFGISGGAQAAANNVLVTLELADGTKGYGEAAPLPAYNGETQAQAIKTLTGAQLWLAGHVVPDWRRAAADFRGRGGAWCGSAQCAFEMALVDAVTKQRGEPLWKFFGGAGTGLETDMTVTTGTAAEAADATRAILKRGIRMVKVKVGGKGGPAHDLERVFAIHEVAPDSPLILDGNAGVSRDAASELVRGLKARGIRPALLEQWLAKDDLAGARALMEESGWLVAADETVTTAADARRVVAARSAGVINIKLMKGGLAEALDIVAVAKSAGLGLMIGGNVESILAMTVSACFAAGQGGFDFADLDTPMFLASNPFDGGYALDGGKISVAHIAAGHGVIPK